jgi:UDP-glucose 4-epimerase
VAGEPAYLQAELTDAGHAFAVVRDAEAVVHAAAIPDPHHNPPQVVFGNNLLATFNLLEAAVRLGVRRFVNISSETVPGFAFPERPFVADYCPVDEDHPVRPQDPYALSKHFGEQLMDAAVRRSDLRGVSLRPSWVQWAGNYERNLGPEVRDPGPSANFWSYVDVDDLAAAIRLAVEVDTPGHEVCYVAAADNATGRPLAGLVRRFFGDRVRLRELPREDASGISCAKAERLLGWRPVRSWRDHLDEHGHLRPEVTAGR